jgi:hypothetical protein
MKQFCQNCIVLAASLDIRLRCAKHITLDSQRQFTHLLPVTGEIL